MIGRMLGVLLSAKIALTKFAPIHGKGHQFPEGTNEDCGSSPDG